MTIAELNLSPEALKLMEQIVADAGNWGGTPPTFNFISGKTDPAKGYLTALKRKGLLSTFKSDGDEWIQFSDLAKQLWPVLA
jgi:hypothetical protein